MRKIHQIVCVLMIMTASIFAQDRPNFLIIVADDLGYADVGYHHLSKDIPTPNIDQLAKKGVAFKNGYVTAPVCGPSRAALLTGSYQQRFGFKDNPGPFRPSPEVVPGISSEFPTIAEILQSNDYQTVAIGKWHLGGQEGEEFLPINKGFDHYYGFLGGASSYYFEDECSQFFMEDDQPIQTPNVYLTDLFGQKAINYFDQYESEKPFFMYWAPNAVHTPLQAPKEVIKKFDHIKDPARRKLVAMQYVMDQNIGKMVDKLKERGLYDNTFIVFISDNGGKPDDNASLNLPLNGQKGTLYEGGIKIPYFMHYPKEIPQGKTFEPMVTSMDIYPTILNLAGVEAPKHLNGENLLPYIKWEKDEDPHQQLFWKNANKWCVRDGDWKLFFDQKNKKVRLYNIAKDPYEKNDLFDVHPEEVSRLKEIYAKWNERNSSLAWGWNPAAVGKYKVHTQFTFEDIIPEKFHSDQFNQVLVIENPHRKGLNKSAYVLGLSKDDEASTASVVVKHTPLTGKELGHCHLKLLSDQSFDVELKIVLGEEKISKKIIKKYEGTGEWQDLVFDYADVKGRVKGMEVVFHGLTSSSKIYLDDIWWNKQAQPIIKNEDFKVEQKQFFPSVHQKNKKVLTWKPVPNINRYDIYHKGELIQSTSEKYVLIPKAYKPKDITIKLQNDIQ
ncbi:sulfatase-like hydrolase/transferase [Flammeovirga yaeyamensis]|uniref:Sulfatase-like hydrolase/transferase n=2 Tax=Flammeovirga yaeyamensis TaxID=367791 RepID=A0AAX1NCP1_9BACT|nr:sulfatase-like hydrolase/transferase [Flammeovirga yaeyamensis]MBB3697090.1 arylsulfatase A-like enzyme [Flammeovirga yaeyamensis]NMF33752.1 sulfatase-like hydrolase/transferase [Flammeovirga yaeyamensis]QWG04982.1 sulfatase-like hydrolase/transferase [Flammeovirga yaeyamensis]